MSIVYVNEKYIFVRGNKKNKINDITIKVSAQKGVEIYYTCCKLIVN